MDSTVDRAAQARSKELEASMSLNPKYDAHALQVGYREGWITACKWACLDDMISDVGSLEYLKDMADALIKVQQRLIITRSDV